MLKIHPHDFTKSLFFFDNGSTDGSVEFVEAKYPAARVTRLGFNHGYSFPVNEGIRQSTGEYVLVLNVDVVLEERFIEEMVRALDNYPTAGWAAAKIFKLKDSGRSEELDCLGHHMSRGRYARERDYSRPFDWKDYTEDRFVFGASACAALYRRTMLEDLKWNEEYFDEDFFAYFEDVDLDWRAQQRGWKCIYVAKAVGYHCRGGSGLINRPEIAACYLANRWLMLVKNDTLRHILPDLIPFALRLSRDIVAYAGSSPLAVITAGKRFIKYLPKMLRKRRTIQKQRTVPLAYIRGLIH